MFWIIPMFFKRNGYEGIGLEGIYDGTFYGSVVKPILITFLGIYYLSVPMGWMLNILCPYAGYNLTLWQQHVASVDYIVNGICHFLTTVFTKLI